MGSKRVVALALGTLLAACQGERTPDAAKQAGGQILEGSVSDAMLPLDRVRSQPPLAPKSELGGDAKGGAAPKAKGSDEPQSAEPAAEPAPEAEAPTAEPSGE